MKRSDQSKVWGGGEGGGGGGEGVVCGGGLRGFFRGWGLVWGGGGGGGGAVFCCSVAGASGAGHGNTRNWVSACTRCCQGERRHLEKITHQTQERE